MQIESGLFDHGVLQRNSQNRSQAQVRGTTSAAGPTEKVRARVTAKNRPLPGFSSKIVGEAKGGKFAASLDGVPVGGPYTIELRVGAERGLVKDVLVGDVWISAGQSNMDGVGLLAEAATPHPRCRAFYMDDHWDVAHDPIHETGIAVDDVHLDLRGGVRGERQRVVGTGPAVAFIQEMQRVTGIPQGVIACAHGGTSMAQWSPDKKGEAGKSLYGASLRRFEKNGGRIAGIIWYQGESESQSAERAADYTPLMKKLVAAFRRDLRSPGLPFAVVQISRVVGLPGFAGWNAVQEAQRLLPDAVDRLTTVPAVDLTLDDGIHIGGAAQQRLGRRLAGAMLALLRHPKAGPGPIFLKSVVVKKDAQRDVANVIVEFGDVAKELRSGERAFGFTVKDAAGSNFVFDIRVERIRAILRTDRSPKQIVGMQLAYGADCDPVCTIVDALDRSLPVFGPVVLGKADRVQNFAAPGAGRKKR